METFTFSLIEQAQARISAKIHRTPVLTCKYFDDFTGRHIHFKAENLQKTGSFKARGALNAVIKATESGCAGVVTHSSGNHGQALAWAASQAKIPCVVVVPENAPKIKLEAIAAYGAQLVTCKPTMEDRVNTCKKIEDQSHFKLIHPHDDLEVMAGQGTIGLELLDEISNFDAVVVPTGGGGMLSGIAMAVKSKNPRIKIYAVEPEGKNLATVVASDTQVITDLSNINTIADGMRVRPLGSRCFPVLKQLCERTIFSVNDAEIIKAMRLIWERLKLVIEPSSGTGVAAIMKPEFAALDSSMQNVAVILCGGNVDLENLPWLAN